jgi:predicted nucleic acid-binding protein
VVDTNIFVSVVLGGYISEEFSKVPFEDKFKLIYSSDLLSEALLILFRSISIITPAKFLKLI